MQKPVENSAIWDQLGKAILRAAQAEAELAALRGAWKKVWQLKSVTDRDGSWIAYKAEDIRAFEHLLAAVHPEAAQEKRDV